MIRAGQLRNRVEIQVPVRSRTAQGGSAVAWAVLREVWCAILQTYDLDLPHNSFRVRNTTREKEYAGKMRSDQRQRIVMRAQTERLTTDMRLVETTLRQNNPNYRVFNITESVLQMDITDELSIGATEVNCEVDDATADYNVMFNDSGYAALNDSGDYGAVLA